MPSKKKLQVFVSSTYTDLLEERQAAVQAILTAGHIPAGMELFAAGDESQMETIKHWIDESDVYMLILGGRYGSIEPKSQKSYVHLEYEYAMENGKPLFAVVVDEKYLSEKAKKDGYDKVIELDQREKFKDFRAQVVSKMVRFWSDPKDIKLAILEKMPEFARHEDLVGWIPGNEAINTGAVAEEIARLAKENAGLREQVANASATQFNGLTFEQIYTMTNSFILDEAELVSDIEFGKELEEFAKIVGDEKPTLVHYFWILSKRLVRGYGNRDKYIVKLDELGLVRERVEGNKRQSYAYVMSSDTYLTQVGRTFLLHLRVKKNYSAYEDYILE